MKSIFKSLVLVFLQFFSLFVGFSQDINPEKVKLIEKQNGKRLELYAKNTDTISYVVFLRVTTDDYRRTSKRPVLKPIAPSSETHLLTLIKLAGSAGSYDHQFIVNEVSDNLEFRKDYEDLQINFDQALETAKITIYQSNNCEFCAYTKALFLKNKIAFNERNIEADTVLLQKLLKKKGKPIDHLNEEVLILEIESEIYRGIQNRKQLFEVLQKHME